MPGQKLIVGIVAIVVLMVAAIFLTPMRWSILGMKGEVGLIGAHTKASFEDSSEVGLMKLRDYLEDNGYEARQIQAPSVVLADLQQYDAVLFFSPESELDQGEIDAIHTYVQNGGSFLITGTGWGAGRRKHANNITESWGFQFMNTKCYEPEQAYTDYGVSVSQYTVAADGLVEGNPIAERITYPYVVRNHCTIEITDPSKVNKALTLSGYAFGEHYSYQDLMPNEDHGEPVAEDAIVMVNGEISSGRVVGMGGYEMYMNKWIDQSEPAENAKSMLFVLDWLTNQ